MVAVRIDTILRSARFARWGRESAIFRECDEAAMGDCGVAEGMDQVPDNLTMANSLAVKAGEFMLMRPLAYSVGKILEVEAYSRGKDWWSEYVESNPKLKDIRLSNEPASSDFLARINSLQITNSLELIFSNIGLFLKKWKRRGVTLANLIKEGRNSSSHFTSGEQGFSRREAMRYLLAMCRMCEVIGAGPTLNGKIRRLYTDVRDGRTDLLREWDSSEDPGLSPIAVDPAEVLGRWYDDDALREDVYARIPELGPKDVVAEIRFRIRNEAGRAVRMRACTINMIPPRLDQVEESGECVTLVVLPQPLGRKVGRDAREEPEKQAEIVMSKTPYGPRLYRNRVVFIYSLFKPYQLLSHEVLEYLALKKVEASSSDSERARLRLMLSEMDADLDERLRDAYSNLLVPDRDWEPFRPRYRHIEVDHGNMLDETFDRLTGSGMMYDWIGRMRLRRCHWCSTALLQELNGAWGDLDHIPVGNIWREHCSDMALPRLESYSIVPWAVRQGVMQEQFAYAGWMSEPCKRKIVRGGRVETVQFPRAYHEVVRSGELAEVDRHGLVVKNEALSGSVVLMAEDPFPLIPAPSDAPAGGRGEEGGHGDRCLQRHGRGVPQRRRSSRGDGAPEVVSRIEGGQRAQRDGQGLLVGESHKQRQSVRASAE